MSGHVGSELRVVRLGETQIRALEALRPVAEEYGLPNLGKPCLAFILDGNGGGAARHEQAFLIAIECRAQRLSERETERVLTRWAGKIGYSPREACRAIRNAFAKRPGGEYKYFPPGLVKKPGTLAHRVLDSICTDVGCPQNCLAFSAVRLGPRGESFERFEALQWPYALRRDRHSAAVDFYQAICTIERDLGLAPGVLLRTSSRQLAEVAGRNRAHALENLRILYTSGLLADFRRGSGSGPHAHDRRPTELRRALPIPQPPARLLPR
jgi:hypothetical protein